MSNRGADHQGLGSIVNSILLISLVLVLPGIHWSLFGWLPVLLPLLTFYLLSRYGLHAGNRILLTAMGLSFLVFLILQRVDFFFFSLSLLPVGYVLAHSSSNNETPATSGLKGALTLAGCWLIVFIGLSVGSEISFYAQLLRTLDEGINEALIYYRASDTLSADTLILLENTLLQMKASVPLVMPSILGSFVLLVTWFTMIVGNRLIFKISGKTPWQRYSYWQLPDKLIWVVILMGGISLIFAPPFRDIGINGIILLSLIYCFQGLAVGVFFMDKWKVPIVFRSFFYVMIVFQSVGTIVLLFVGIADIWLNFRKLNIENENITD